MNRFHQRRFQLVYFFLRIRIRILDIVGGMFGDVLDKVDINGFNTIGPAERVAAPVFNDRLLHLRSSACVKLRS